MMGRARHRVSAGMQGGNIEHRSKITISGLFHGFREECGRGVKSSLRGLVWLGIAILLLGSILALSHPSTAPPGDGIDRVVIQRDPGPTGTWAANGTYYLGDMDVFWLV